MSSTLSDADFVASVSNHVKINTDRLADLDKKVFFIQNEHWFKHGPISADFLSERDKLTLLFVVSALSFSYWGDPKWTIKQGSDSYSGTWGLLATLLSEAQFNQNFLSFENFKTISSYELQRIFSANVVIPLFESRLQILRRLGEVMCELYGSDPIACVAQAQGSIPEFVQNLVTVFIDVFNDVWLYKNRYIHFNKRAQMLAADISRVFFQNSWSLHEGIECLTALSDYKLPQILRFYGVLEYDEELSWMIAEKKEIECGTGMEIEIRAATLVAVEQIRKQNIQQGKRISAMDINDCLWLSSKQLPFDTEPHHRTRTSAY